MDAHRINVAIRNNEKLGITMLAEDLRDLADEIEAGMRVVTMLCTSEQALPGVHESMLLIKTVRRQ